MKPIIAAAALLATCTMLHSADYRWTSGFAQGTSEAIIRNRDGASVNLYCPAGQIDTTPGLFIKSEKVRPQSGEEIYVQVVIDDSNFPLGLRNQQFEAASREALSSLHSLINAITKSRSRSFLVEFPQLGISETFSLVGARRALGSARSFLEGCD